MKMFKIFIGAFFVGAISLLYNFMIFRIFNFYPDLPIKVDFIGNSIYLAIFLKNFLFGLLLMYLFSVAYSNILKEKEEARGIIFFILYAIVAFGVFSIGDLFLMGFQEGMFVVLTFNGLVEMMIVTIPIKLFYIEQ